MYVERTLHRTHERRIIRIRDDFKRAPLSALGAAWDGFMIDDWAPVPPQIVRVIPAKVKP